MRLVVENVSIRYCCALRWAFAKHGIQRFNLFFRLPHPISRQLPAIWSGGVFLTLLTGSGFGLRLLLTDNVRGLLAWLVGALFIPTFALALRVGERDG